MPYGSNCDCKPYPPLTADGLTTATGQTVTAPNDAVPGYTTSDVLHQLNSDRNVIDHVRAADAIEIEIGANDVAHSDAGNSVDCYAPHVPAIEKNLAAIVSRPLTAGPRVTVRACKPSQFQTIERACRAPARGGGRSSPSESGGEAKHRRIF